jgi:hypothetical protein
MHRSQFSEQELTLEAERYVKYQGTARVRLEVLHFQWNELRELRRKNVERLKENFRGDKGHMGTSVGWALETIFLLWLSSLTLTTPSSLLRSLIV